jgi:hypothetical protein
LENNLIALRKLVEELRSQLHKALEAMKNGQPPPVSKGGDNDELMDRI